MNIRSLSIIIPCYNEATRINNLLIGLEDFLVDWPVPCEVIIVNDGSVDNTGDVIKASPLYRNLHSKGQIEFVDEKVNRGKGYALRNGVLRAKYDRVLTMDAYMATHPNQLKVWSERLNGNFNERTVYIGCRIHRESHISDRNIRKFVGVIFNRFVKMASGLPLDDTQCGFKLYPAKAAHKAFTDLKTFGWAHDVELLSRCNKEGYNIVEEPVEWSAIEGSKISVVRDSIKMFLQLLRIKGIIRQEYK